MQATDLQVFAHLFNDAKREMQVSEGEPGEIQVHNVGIGDKRALQEEGMSGRQNERDQDEGESGCREATNAGDNDAADQVGGNKAQNDIEGVRESGNQLNRAGCDPNVASNQ
jgi:hypothetical protein